MASFFRSVRRSDVAFLVVILPGLLLTSSPAPAQSVEPTPIAGLGALAFPNTGAPAAQPAFVRGMLALHSFWYVEARRAFREARQLDPRFAMAYWGEALTWDHPVWGPQDTRHGRQVLVELDGLHQDVKAGWTARERAYVEAARELFGSGSKAQRRRAFEKRLQEIAQAYPSDDEARAFHALMVVANNSHGGEGRRAILEAADTLEELLEGNPEHPGAYHYLIHAYDHPDHVERAVPLAERYPEVAGAAPHAVHMPAHIYRRLGQWERVAESCKEAYDTSVRWVRREGLPNTERDFHSLQWLHTAYLRLGEYDRARGLHAHIDEIAADGGERRRLNGIRASMMREYRRRTP